MTSNKSKSNPQSNSKKPKDLSIRREAGTKDDRTSTRVPVQLLVDYHCNGTYLFDFCKDLGTGGVFIETAAPLETGSFVNLTFTLPDSKETLDAKGKVIWVQSEVPGKNASAGMGVQFEGFDSQQRQLLEAFVTRYHGDTLNKKAEKDGKASA